MLRRHAIATEAMTKHVYISANGLKPDHLLMNIGSCILALGILTPLLMLAKRYSAKDNTEFKTKAEIREKLIKEGKIQAD